MYSSQAFAPSNIALVKYWGKRDSVLNLPVTDSLSLSLNLGTTTSISESKDGVDEVWLNNFPLHPNPPPSGRREKNPHNLTKSTAFAEKIFDFIAPYRDHRKIKIETTSDIPVAAGLASSASGFAALTLAMNDFYNLNLNKTELSVIARQGSGSACRSLWPGLVKWQKGEKPDGSDSHGIPLEADWSELSMCALLLTEKPKSIGSREGMIQCQETSPLYSNWPGLVEKDISLALNAIQTKDFEKLGDVIEHSATEMHRCMRASKPTIDYSLPETHTAIQTIQNLRQQGHPVYFTQDAGPNIKIMHLKSDTRFLEKLSDYRILML